MNRASVVLQDNSAGLLRTGQSVLQRKCACGNQTIAGGECTDCAKKNNSLQRKLSIGASNDPLEREADRIADQVMAMPTNSNIIGKATPNIQRLTAQATGQAETAPASVDWVLASSGKPMEPALRQDMESRFGHDFSQVRVHTDGLAEQSAHDVNAQAYTVGSNVVFGAGRYAPSSHGGRKLLAHELTHVVQQRAAPSTQYLSANENRETQIGEVRKVKSSYMMQRYPGDGLKPPGVCGWGKYLILKKNVAVVKNFVSGLGRCYKSDNCLVLATKIAAASAEIAARVVLNKTCFLGGDKVHRDRVDNKVNMMKRCQTYFTASDCSQDLVQRMSEVVRNVVMVAAGLVAVVAFISAIIVLVEAVIAIGTAVVVAASAVAVIVMLKLIRDQILSENSPTT